MNNEPQQRLKKQFTFYSFNAWRWSFNWDHRFSFVSTIRRIHSFFFVFLRCDVLTASNWGNINSFLTCEIMQVCTKMWNPLDIQLMNALTWLEFTIFHLKFSEWKKIRRFSLFFTVLIQTNRIVSDARFSLVYCIVHTELWCTLKEEHREKKEI